MDLALARTAAAIHGYCKVSRRLPAPAMATEAIRAPAVRRNPKRSIPAATATVTEAGSSILPASIGAQGLVETAAHRPMIMIRTV